ncbi:Uncharacterised protein [Serratia fonticola]|nr:Uncharacterised protein [Serratia fonticola]
MKEYEFKCRLRTILTHRILEPAQLTSAFGAELPVRLGVISVP